jgi:xylulokinase
VTVSASRLSLAILANVPDRPLDRPRDSGLGAAYGAARLGMAAALGADPAAIMTPPALAETVKPVPELVARYAESYTRYRALNPATRQILQDSA